MSTFTPRSGLVRARSASNVHARDLNQDDANNNNAGDISITMDHDNNSGSNSSRPAPTRSQYYLSRNEILKGIANRFLFSQFYVIFYLALAGASFVAVLLSLGSDCPSTAFYALEVIVNVCMVAEVSVRLVAFGKQFWKSYFNIMDLLIVGVCVITLMVVFFTSKCSGKSEELFDDLLLIGRNMIQFARLALIFRRSGKSIFGRGVSAIDLDDVDLDGDADAMLDLDLDDEEAQLRSRRAQAGDPGARQQQQQQSRGSQGYHGAASKPLFGPGSDSDDDDGR